MLTLITTNVTKSDNWAVIYEQLGIALAIVALCLIMNYLNKKNKNYGQA